MTSIWTGAAVSLRPIACPAGAQVAAGVRVDRRGRRPVTVAAMTVGGTAHDRAGRATPGRHPRQAGAFYTDACHGRGPGHAATGDGSGAARSFDIAPATRR